MGKNTIILAIESSCDDTSAAVIVNGKIASNIIATQKVHEAYGGVVPELASRAHLQHIVPTVASALAQAQVQKNELSAVAFTQGPGLLGSLLVGTCFAKGLALGLNIPLIEINHLQAHILAHFIDAPTPEFPMLCLTVSGGHTQIVRLDSHFEMHILGQTMDDAAGEAFDKIGKIMGLGYPAGAVIDALSAKGDADKFSFSEPQIPNYDFSFSGFKTSFLYFVQKETAKNEDFIAQNLNDLCASVQRSIVHILMKKLQKAAQDTQIKHIAIAGGVSANGGLRKALHAAGEKNGWKTYVPALEYCTDNAAMIAMAAHFKFEKNDFSTHYCAPNPRLKMS